MQFHPLERRSSGILLHPTSLPSGRLDDDVLRWLDFLADASQRVWQVLPLGVPVFGLSPYQCLSAFAANPALLPGSYSAKADPSDADFQAWAEQQAFWLPDFAMFMLLKRLNGGRPWYEWPVELRDRQPGSLEATEVTQAQSLIEIQWQQYQVHRQWQWVRDEAHARGIGLFGDMPIFVAHDSADVWSARRRFLLDDAGQLRKISGVPPDYFSATGQRWGNPHYDWSLMQAEGFSWWLRRLEQHFHWFDLVRIDHFRGLHTLWMIEPTCETAEVGEWAEVPGADLLEKLQQQMGEVPLVAEDLGTITPEVVALKERFGLPGMAVEQFSFDGAEDNPHKPQNISPNTVVYTGTHDNDTTAGWFNHLPDAEKQTVLSMLDIQQPEQLVDAMIERAMHTAANLCILPLQDVLHLDSSARMNIPGDNGEHWQWRFDWSQVNSVTASRLRDMTCHAGRC